VLGHGGSGKTTLVDALAFVAGSTRRHGSADEGTALTMYTPEEIDHGLSMQTTPAIAEWEGTKINLLDTPGYIDFTGEALAATRVCDGAVIVLGATTGRRGGDGESLGILRGPRDSQTFFRLHDGQGER
jgi:elongation factor G